MQTNLRFKNPYTTAQTSVLVLLRMLIGWHLLYEGVVKLQNPNWSSAGFLMQSKGFLKGFSNWIISSPKALYFVDILNEWGLAILGLFLILGLFTRFTSLMAGVLLMLYYLNSPPLLDAIKTTQGNYLIINQLLIESVTLFTLYFFPTGKIVGLDMFIDYFKRK
ncbi:MAG: DoxX family membrane protein [Flavobacteriaceae bacterium]|nr:DoxX family membrane protein [Flavobacteriaceae bacterium]